MKNEKGVVLVIALIALVAMSLAGISLMRTVDTTNVISGNLAFGEAAVQMEDVAQAQAMAWIVNNAASSGSTTCLSAGGSACPSYYYPDVMPIDPNTKLPNPGTGVSLNWSPAITTGLPSGYQVQYIIERMCGSVITTGSWNTAKNTNGAIATFANCEAAPVYDTAWINTSGQVVNPPNTMNAGSGYTSLPNVLIIGGGTGASLTVAFSGTTPAISVTGINPPSAPGTGTGYTSPPVVVFTGGCPAGCISASTIQSTVGNPGTNAGLLYFRVTVMVTGPRNTTGMAQYFLNIEDTVNN